MPDEFRTGRACARNDVKHRADFRTIPDRGIHRFDPARCDFACLDDHGITRQQRRDCIHKRQDDWKIPWRDVGDQSKGFAPFPAVHAGYHRLPARRICQRLGSERYLVFDDGVDYLWFQFWYEHPSRVDG